MSTVSTQEKNLTYSLDPTHSTIEFIARHLMITKVRGNFGAFEGTIELSPGNDVPQAVSVKIDAATVNTREPRRDAHLASADFLEVEKYPELRFESDSVEGTPSDFQVRGQLTIHGVTREVVLAGEFEGGGPDPWGGKRVAYSAKTAIRRSDFGLVWNQALESGGVVVSDEIQIELNVQAVLQQ